MVTKAGFNLSGEFVVKFYSMRYVLLMRVALFCQSSVKLQFSFYLIMLYTGGGTTDTINTVVLIFFLFFFFFCQISVFNIIFFTRTD